MNYEGFNTCGVEPGLLEALVCKLPSNNRELLLGQA